MITLQQKKMGEQALKGAIAFRSAARIKSKGNPIPALRQWLRGNDLPEGATRGADGYPPGNDPKPKGWRCRRCLSAFRAQLKGSESHDEGVTKMLFDENHRTNALLAAA